MHHSINELNRRILVIDDNPAIHEDFRKILAPEWNNSQLDDAEAAFFGETRETDTLLSFEIDYAEQGQQGLTKVLSALERGCPYAMAFVDMRMPPGWDGLVTIEEIWKHDPDLQIVICTAYSDYTWAEISSRLGNNDKLLILKKPFDNAEVCQFASALTAKWTLTQQAGLKQADLERMVNEQIEKLERMHARLEQKQRLESIGGVAASFSNEFNNLFQMIQGFTDFLLQDTPSEDPRHHDLTHIQSAVTRGATLTGNLLSFSQKQCMKSEALSAADVISEFVQLFKPTLRKDIQLVLDLSDNLPTVFADHAAVQQAMFNICFNACDAMPDGGTLTISSSNVRLSVNDLENDADMSVGRYAEIRFTDTGCGMTPDVKKQIFEPFFTTKDVGQGTGLGLSTAYGTVRQLGGTINAESKQKNGTTIQILLPAADEAPTMEKMTTSELLMPAG